MNKLVYLFELDSVRETEVEIIEGQRAIFNEILKNGNYVALSLNQLVDSHAFTRLTADEKVFPYILALFEAGALRVSLYGGMTTPSKYMQNSLDKCSDSNDNFKFTSLPIKKEEKGKIKMLKDALVNSDLSEIKEHITKLKEDIRNGTECDQNIIELKDYEHLLKHIELILKISLNETSNIPKKPKSERGYMWFMQKIKAVASGIKVDSEVWNANLNKVMEALDEIQRKIETENIRIEEENRKNALLSSKASDIEYKELKKIDIINRTNWLDRVFIDDKSLKFAVEMIIHLCYNYTIEESISGATKHYNDSEFEKSFLSDVQKRIQDCLDIYEQKAACKHQKPLKVSEWKRLRRIVDIRKSATVETGVYEDTYKSDRKRWHSLILKEFFKSLGLIAVYIVLFFVVEMFLSLCENLFMPFLSALTFSDVITKLLTVLLFGILSSLLSKKIPDILECFVRIEWGIADVFMVYGGKYDSYRQY